MVREIQRHYVRGLIIGLEDARGRVVFPADGSRPTNPLPLVPTKIAFLS